MRVCVCHYLTACNPAVAASTTAAVDMQVMLRWHPQLKFHQSRSGIDIPDDSVNVACVLASGHCMRLAPTAGIAARGRRTSAPQSGLTIQSISFAVQDDRIQNLVSAADVAQLFRTPGLSESAAAALKQEAHDAGLTSISDISMEMARPFKPYKCHKMLVYTEAAADGIE